MNPEQPAEAIFSGTFERSLDAKNRVTIPSSWVQQGVIDFQIVPNHNADEPFLIALPPLEFARIEERIQALSRPAPEKRKAIRSFYSSARAVSIDKQGRILLPEDYCKKAKLGSEVVLLGGKSRFEIWSAACWHEESAANTESLTEIFDEAGL